MNIEQEVENYRFELLRFIVSAAKGELEFGEFDERVKVLNIRLLSLCMSAVKEGREDILEELNIGDQFSYEEFKDVKQSLEDSDLPMEPLFKFKLNTDVLDDSASQAIARVH